MPSKPSPAGPDDLSLQDATQPAGTPEEGREPPKIPARLAFFFDTGMPVWRYVLQMVVMSFIPTMVLANILAGVGVVTEENVPKFPGPPMVMFIGIVIVSPLVETLMMAGIFWLLSFVTRNLLWLAIASSVIWGLLHATTTPVWGVVILWAFFVFSCAFLAWRRHSWGKAVGITSAIHALHNLLPAIAVLLAGPPGDGIEAEPAKPNINAIQPGAVTAPARSRIGAVDGSNEDSFRPLVCRTCENAGRRIHSPALMTLVRGRPPRMPGNDNVGAPSRELETLFRGISGRFATRSKRPSPEASP